MPTLPPRSNSSTTGELPQDLTERVAERVIKARLALEQRAKATRAKPRRRAAASGSSLNSVTDAELQETRSLKRVFRDFGNSYRRYRRQVGGPVEPGLREAAYRFRAEPTLASLVAVAGYLDELDLLS